MNKYKIIKKDINEIKKKAYKYYCLGKLESALNMVEFFGHFMYQVNIKYVDNDIELLLNNIAVSLGITPHIKTPEVMNILFYDGFGLDKRGLAYIYLKALTSLGYKITYVVPEDRKDNIPQITKLLKNNNGKIYYLCVKDKIVAIKTLVDIVEKRAISKFVLYIQPNDSVAITTSMLFQNIVPRFMINLTDHAFWMGQSAIDYTIEFRDYGCYISWKKRNITKDKIKLLPYYPEIDKTVSFQGFPFNTDGKQIMFSGGALYKTFGANMKYYEMVKEILKRNQNLIFVYAGTGDGSELEKMKEIFPNRVYWIAEREDLYQVMKNSDIYLSTYPMAGGLMTQYAVAAKTVPLTLVYDECGLGFIRHPETIKCEFKDSVDLINYASDILSNKIQLEKSVFENQIVSEKEFENALYNILENRSSLFESTFQYVSTTEFQKTYIERLDVYNYLKLWANTSYIFVARSFPIRFLIGSIYKIILRITKEFKHK